MQQSCDARCLVNIITLIGRNDDIPDLSCQLRRIGPERATTSEFQSPNRPSRVLKSITQIGRPRLRCTVPQLLSDMCVRSLARRGSPLQKLAGRFPGRMQDCIVTDAKFCDEIPTRPPCSLSNKSGTVLVLRHKTKASRNQVLECGFRIARRYFQVRYRR